MTPTETPTPIVISFQDEVYPSSSYSGTEDTYITTENPSSNYGSSTFLYAEQYMVMVDPYTMEEVYADTLIKFDVSAIPPGADIISACLEVDVYEVYGAASTYEVYIDAAPSDWDESTVTYGSYGRADACCVSAGEVTSTGVQQWTHSNMDEIVQNWVDNPPQNYGFEISASIETTVLFRSSENTEGAKPKLIVEYTAP